MLNLPEIEPATAAAHPFLVKRPRPQAGKELQSDMHWDEVAHAQ